MGGGGLPDKFLQHFSCTIVLNSYRNWLCHRFVFFSAIDLWWRRLMMLKPKDCRSNTQALDVCCWERGHLSLFHSRRHFSVPYTIIMQITQYGRIRFSFDGWRQSTQTTTDRWCWLQVLASFFFFLMCECVVARTDKLNSRNTRLLGRWCRQQLGAPFLYLKKKLYTRLMRWRNV